MTHDELIAACVQIICRHAGRAGLQVIVFGSHARGDAYPGSDIDLGILGPTPVPQLIMARMRADIDALRTLRTVDVVDLAAVGAGLRTEALAHGRVVYVHPPAAA